MKSIRTKLITIILASILLTAGIIGGVGVFSSLSAIQDDSYEIMELLCEVNAKNLNAILKEIEISVETLAVYTEQQIEIEKLEQNNPEYEDAISEKIFEVALNAANNTTGAIAFYTRFNPEFTSPTSGIFCSRKDLSSEFERLVPTDFSKYPPDDIEHVGWYYIPAAVRRGAWMEPYFNKNLGFDMISYVVPIYDNDVMLGVVGMDIHFDVLRILIDDVKIYENGYAFLVDDEANVLYHKNLAIDSNLFDAESGTFIDVAKFISKNTTSPEKRGVVIGEIDNNSALSTKAARVSIGSNKDNEVVINGQKNKVVLRELRNTTIMVIIAPSVEIDARAHRLTIQLFACAAIIAVAAFVLATFITRRLIAPLIELNDVAQRFAEGDLTVDINHHSNDEIGMLADSFRMTARNLNSHISVINTLAYCDQMTGVKNKTAYEELSKSIDNEIKEGGGNALEFAIIVLDINNLKRINDTYGHAMGDKLIIETCDIICRTFDRSPVYRIGGDEFVVFLRNNDYENRDACISQLGVSIAAFNEKSDEIDPSERPFRIAVAHGIAVYKSDSDPSFQSVFERADSEMYLNKKEMKRKTKGNDL